MISFLFPVKRGYFFLRHTVQTFSYKHEKTHEVHSLHMSIAPPNTKWRHKLSLNAVERFASQKNQHLRVSLPVFWLENNSQLAYFLFKRRLKFECHFAGFFDKIPKTLGNVEEDFGSITG